MLYVMKRKAYLTRDIGHIQWFTLLDVREKGKADRTIQLQSDYGDGDGITMKSTDVDSRISKDEDVDSVRIKDRDVDSTGSADSAARTVMVPRLSMENSEHSWLRRIFRKGTG
jgi:hypothetical protein